MTELLNHPNTEAEPYDPSTQDGEIVQGEVIEASTDATDTSADEIVERGPENPPQATLLDRAASRLTRLSVDRAHTKGLKEDKKRTIEAQVTAQDEAYASYEDNISTTANREESERQEDEAYAMNERFDAKAARAEKIEAAKDKIRGFGRSAFNRFKNAGLTGVALSFMGVEAAGRGAKKTAEVAKTGTAKFGEVVGDGFISGMKKVEAGMDAAGAKASSIKDNMSERRDTRRTDKQKRVEAEQERARKAKEAAIARRAERRAKWAKRRGALKDATVRGAKRTVEATVSGVIKGGEIAGDGFIAGMKKVEAGMDAAGAKAASAKDFAAEKMEKTKNGFRARRAAGRMAINAYREHVAVSKER